MLKISASSLFTKYYLKVDPRGTLVYCETSLFGGVRRFTFSQIDTVLMAGNGVLSFQVGKEVFSIPTKPSNKKHHATIEALLNGVRQSGGVGTPAIGPAASGR